MSRKSEYEKYYMYLTLIGVAIIMVNLYYYCHPLWESFGITHAVPDGFVLKLRAGHLFSTPLKTKSVAALLMIPSLLTRSGRSVSLGWGIIISISLTGIALYLWPFVSPETYMMTTVSGLLLTSVGAGLSGRKMREGAASLNDRAETFQQCDKLIRTDDSINLKTVYKYQNRLHHGWINIVNPFRATIVLGTPGSGKSYSVYGPYIEQMVEKGYSLYVYDFKYPDLTTIVYNEYLANWKKYKVAPEFCVLNFNDPRYSLRCNPIDPDFMTDPADSSEISDTIMKNVNKGAEEKDNPFFTQSAKLYLDALIWFLRNYEGGRFCTVPHVIELMAQDYKKVFNIISRFPEIEVKVKSFVNALEGGAQEQLQGQVASAQVPLNRFVSPALYWALSGHDFTLDINNPDAPKILCVGNNPKRQSIYGTTLALITSQIFKLLNDKGKVKSGVLLDELPTIFLNDLPQLIATARSNGVAIVLGAQDKSQLVKDYGEKEANVILNAVGNYFSGAVRGQSAEDLSKSLGKIFKVRESQTLGIDSDSVNISHQLEELMPSSTIQTLSPGTFVGLVADSHENKIQEKFFCAEIVRDPKTMKRKQSKARPLPRFTDFGEDSIRAYMLKNRERCILAHYEYLLKYDSGVVYRPDELLEAASRKLKALTEKEKKELISVLIEKRIEKEIASQVKANYDRIRAEVKGIVSREYMPSQAVNPPYWHGRRDGGSGRTDNRKKEQEDPRIYDPLNGL